MSFSVVPILDDTRMDFTEFEEMIENEKPATLPVGLVAKVMEGHAYAGRACPEGNRTHQLAHTWRTKTASRLSMRDCASQLGMYFI
jgi:hypothetical protein